MPEAKFSPEEAFGEYFVREDGGKVYLLRLGKGVKGFIVRGEFLDDFQTLVPDTTGMLERLEKYKAESEETAREFYVKDTGSSKGFHDWYKSFVNQRDFTLSVGEVPAFFFRTGADGRLEAYQGCFVGDGNYFLAPVTASHMRVVFPEEFGD